MLGPRLDPPRLELAPFGLTAQALDPKKEYKSFCYPQAQTAQEPVSPPVQNRKIIREPGQSRIWRETINERNRSTPEPFSFSPADDRPEAPFCPARGRRPVLLQHRDYRKTAPEAVRQHCPESRADQATATAIDQGRAESTPPPHRRAKCEWQAECERLLALPSLAGHVANLGDTWEKGAGVGVSSASGGPHSREGVRRAAYPPPAPTRDRQRRPADLV